MAGTVTYKLRSDLVIQRRLAGGRVQYVIKDPLKMDYWTIDEVAHTLLSLCDGRRDLLDLLAEAQRRLPTLGLNLLALRSFYESYRGFHFFEDAWDRNIILIEKQRTTRTEMLRKAAANPMEIHLPAVNPDRVFGKIVRPLGFLFSGTALVVYALMAIGAFSLAVARLDQFVLPLSELYVLKGGAIMGFVTLWGIFLGTVVLHEIGHGLTCKHFGGGVYKIGFLLLYFNPCLYCDVTESFFFENKRHKYAVTLAGGVVNVIVASIAVFIWAFTTPDLLIHQIAQRVALYNALIGLVVNFNPLLKYDGYYVVSDFLEIPNLQGDAFKFLGSRMRRLFRLPAPPDLTTPRERRIFWIYGLASVTYVVLVLWMVYAMAGGWLVRHYHAVGYVLAAGLLYVMAQRYIKGFWRFVRFLFLDKAGHLRRWRLAYGLALLLLGAFLAFVPVPRHVRGEFALRPGEEVVVRAAEPGFIERVLVREGDAVDGGAPLFVLREEEIGLQRVRAETEARVAWAARTAALDTHETALAVSYEAAQRAGESEASFHRARDRRIQPRSPIAGVVLTPRVEENTGLSVAAGDFLCEIGSLDALRAEILLDEQLIGLVDLGAPVELRLKATYGALAEGTIERVAPEPSGGEVRRLFRILVRVDNTNGRLKPGMGGQARFAAGNVPLALQARDWIARMLRVDFWI